MFRNVGGKIRVVSIIFFTLMCMASLLLLVWGIVSGVRLGWAWPIIGGVAGALVGFGFSLVSTYMLFGYGTLVKSCEDNARINAEILSFLRNNMSNLCKARSETEPREEVKAPVVSTANVTLSEPIMPKAPVAPIVSISQEKEVTVEEVLETESPVVEEPIVEEPVIEEPVAEEFVDDTPSIEFEFVEEFVQDTPSDNGEEKTLSLPKDGEPLVKRCPSCGNVVRPQANFCNQCGHKMK